MWQVWYAFIKKLGDNAYISDKKCSSERMVEMYNHGHSGQATEDRIFAEFPKLDSKIRVLITTVAFGMGVNIPDISYVLHWGVPSTVVAYWQEVGRCARDGRPGRAIMYAYSRSINKSIVKPDMIDLCNRIGNGACIRKTVLGNFSELSTSSCPTGEDCCSNCAKSANCQT